MFLLNKKQITANVMGGYSRVLWEDDYAYAQFGRGGSVFDVERTGRSWSRETYQQRGLLPIMHLGFVVSC